MPTIGLVVLIGAVLLVAAVWLTPIDRAVAQTAADGPSDPAGRATSEKAPREAATPGSQPASALTSSTPEPVALVMPALEIERLAQPTASVEGSSAAPRPVVSAADATPSEDRLKAAELHIPFEIGTHNGAALSAEDLPALADGAESPADRAALSATHSEWKPSYTARPERRPKLSSVTYPLTSTATNAVDGGAVSRSAYPIAIPIPVAMSVAETLTPAVDLLPTPEPILPLWRAGSDAQVHTSSSNGSSVSWSPHPTDNGEVIPPPQVWQGSQSVVARVSSSELGERDDNLRKGLLIAAGVVAALAVASRR